RRGNRLLRRTGGRPPFARAAAAREAEETRQERAGPLHRAYRRLRRGRLPPAGPTTARFRRSPSAGLDPRRLAACRTEVCAGDDVPLGAEGRSSWGLHAAFSTNIRFKFQAIITRFHSPLTLSSPRSRNRRNPSTDLMM